MRRELEQVEIPGEHAARERTWNVVRAAFSERQPTQRNRSILRPVAVLVAAAVVAGVIASPPGRAVVDRVREVVGVEGAAPALFSLPTSGKLLVSSDAGVWVVESDGSKRLLGDYREATWSPFGRFVAAASTNELAALEPDGTVRWTLSRRGVRDPRWAGSETDTRIAYVDRTGIRIVAGDGTGDRLLVARAQGPIAWRPGVVRALAYPTRTEIRVVTEAGRLVWRAPRPLGSVTEVAWSSDGRRLLVLTPHRLRVYDASGQVVDEEGPAEGWPDVSAAFRPGTHSVAVARVHGSQSSAYLLEERDLFTGSGEFRQVAWSPDGRWLLVSWPTADQWVFVRARGAKTVGAASNLSAQFRSRSFPFVEGWCCASRGTRG